MQRGFSTYLDGLRIGAALTVFIGHLSWRTISGGFLWPFQALGHDAVIVFFVLSGYVIGFAASTKENSYRSYQIARFARLYSVVIPALILTLACDWFGIHHNPHGYNLGRETEPLFRLIANGLFLSQSWGWSFSLLSNDPFWSLPYEFWCYQLFAVAFFFAGPKRVIVALLCALIAGPQILLLFPVWAFGALAYFASKRIRLNREALLSIAMISAAGFLIILAADEMGIIARATAHWLPPKFSLIDYVAGALAALHLAAMSKLPLPTGSLSKPIAAAAGVTFSLYLFHLPLMHLISAFAPSQLSVNALGILIGCAALVCVVLLSFISEKQKQHWRFLFTSAFHLFRAPPSPATAQ